MPRKGKLDRTQPSSASDAGANKYAVWRRLVKELLASRWQHGSIDVASIAGTVVGMFDAGAKEEEVAAYLASCELSERDEPWLSDSARMALVRELHRSVG
jgi:hypothetical protein